MSINTELFWSYVELWIVHNRFSWESLALECGFGRTKMWRLRKGRGDLTVKEFNCICAGIGLNPLFVLEGSNVYSSPFIMDVA